MKFLLLLFCLVSCKETNVLIDSNSSGVKKAPVKVCTEFLHSKLSIIEIEDVRTVHNFNADEIEEFRCDDDEFIICHVPRGNTENSHFIEVGGLSAITSHLHEVEVNENEIYRAYLLKCDIYEEYKSIHNIRPCALICDE